LRRRRARPAGVEGVRLAASDRRVGQVSAREIFGLLQFRQRHSVDCGFLPAFPLSDGSTRWSHDRIAFISLSEIGTNETWNPSWDFPTLRGQFSLPRAPRSERRSNLVVSRRYALGLQ